MPIQTSETPDPIGLDAAENLAILDYLQSVNAHGFPRAFEREPEDRWYVFWRQFKPEKRYGSHPDAYERLFDTVASGLPNALHRVVYGRDCLIHPDDGRILGFCQGMCYALQLDVALVPNALAAHDRATGSMHPAMRPAAEAWRTTVRAIGGGWVPGCFVEDGEIDWLTESWAHLAR